MKDQSTITVDMRGSSITDDDIKQAVARGSKEGYRRVLRDSQSRSIFVIFMRSCPGRPIHRALTKPLVCEMPDGSIHDIPVGFTWDGSSVPLIFQGVFPRHRHPIASCKHDYRCQLAQNAAERKWADQQFEQDVGKTSWWITKKLGYLGVRVGAFFGVGVRY